MSDAGALDARIERIHAKVRGRAIKLGPTLSERNLSSFEATYGVMLPAEYRQFLLRIGNGTVGPPEYGLVALEEPPTAGGDHLTHTREEFEAMKKVYPFTRPWVWEEGSLSAEGTDDQVENGQLYLGTDGCGMDWVLIVTGPDRGNIWFRCGEGITPTSPKRDFLRWFEDWLDGVRNWWE